MRAKLEQQVTRWLRLLNTNVSSSFIREKIRSNPGYPSFASVTDTLDSLGIDNAVILVGKENMEEIPVPFLTTSPHQKNEIIIVNDLVSFKRTKTYGDWDRVVIIAEKNSKITNPENNLALAKDKKQYAFNTSVLLLLSGIFIWTWSSHFDAKAFSIWLSMLAGLGLAILITQHELGINSKMVGQLCSAGENLNCDAVLRSRASTFLKISWADCGLIYFGSFSVLLSLLQLTGYSGNAFSLLALFAFAALPFTFFSIFYQWRIVKKWCVLCLATVSVLWVQVFLLTPYLNTALYIFPLKEILFSIGLLLCSGMVWLQIKKELTLLKETRDKYYSLLRLKNNTEVFQALLRSQRRIDQTPFEKEIQLGNPSAALQLVVACNPYCGPCAAAHSVFHELLQKNDIGLCIRFTIKHDDAADKKTEAANYILTKTLESNNIRTVVHDWYELMNLEKFKEKYPVQANGKINPLLKQHDDWAEQNKIMFTPTLFINGYEFPKEYRLTDLHQFIREMELQQISKN